MTVRCVLKRGGLLPLVLLAACSPAVPTPDMLTAAEEIGYSARDVELIETDASGQPRYRLRAAELEQDPDSRDVALSRVQLQLSTDDNVWLLRATHATLPADSSRVLLRESVELRGDGTPAIALDTESLDYDYRTQRATSTSAVAIRLQAGQLTAQGIDADLAQRRIYLGRDVYGRFSP